MGQQAQWTIDVALDEDSTTTRADVRLCSPGGASFVGVGVVQGGPRGVHLPQIAAELAIARALGDLTEELLEAVATDIESSIDDATSSRCRRLAATEPRSEVVEPGGSPNLDGLGFTQLAGALGQPAQVPLETGARVGERVRAG